MTWKEILSTLCPGELPDDEFFSKVYAGEQETPGTADEVLKALSAAGYKEIKEGYSSFVSRYTALKEQADRALQELKENIAESDKRAETDFSKRSNWMSAPPAAINLVSLDKVEEKEPEWLIKDYLPKNQITILAGDGGAGKTSVWCALAAGVSSGNRSFLEHGETENPFTGHFKEPGKVLFFSSEDSAEYTLKRRLRKNGAKLENIYYLSLTDEHFPEIKFNSPLLKELIKQHRPDLVIFDPLQSFIPPEFQMGQRNVMRASLNPLIGIGEEYGTTFLIIVHTNKRSGVWGRQRISDSSDIWDIARSVLIAGEAEDNLRYLSQEKSNYGALADTVLFNLSSGKIEFSGYSDKRDKDFVSEAAASMAQAPQRADAKEFILEYLRDGEKETAELNEAMKAQGVSSKTLERAKTELRKEGKIVSFSTGYGKEKKFFYRLTQAQTDEKGE